jgi:hypothetical protein
MVFYAFVFLLCVFVQQAFSYALAGIAAGVALVYFIARASGGNGRKAAIVAAIVLSVASVVGLVYMTVNAMSQLN